MVTIFNDENLYHHFSPASLRDSIVVAGKKLFDFIDRKSKCLVVSIGDSWSWGADLTQQKLVDLHIDRTSDDEYRIKNVFGNILADRLNADFLCLGESGAGNWHIAKKIQELCAIQRYLTYDKIIVVGILTETGRDYNSHNDITVDYRSWLLTHINAADDYNNFLAFINQQIASTIYAEIMKFDTRYHFIFGTNFVDAIGFDMLNHWWLPKTWTQVICDNRNVDYLPDRCYVVFPWVIQKFESVFDMAPELDRNTWLQWINDVTQRAIIRSKLLPHDDVEFARLLHPLAKNHLIWADYIHGRIDHAAV